LMIDLAIHYGEGPILLKDIAQRQGISEKYLWHIVNPLKVSGLISSLRGAKGGYLLAKPPKEINVKDVMGVLEGSLCLVDCVDNPSICERAGSCISRDLWGETSVNLLRTLESTTLAHLAERQIMKEEGAH
jgi:Rrf2 family protein